MVITFFNQKGGVGKTTSSVLLTDYIKYKNPERKILLIDLDPQGSLSETFIFNNENSYTLLDYFTKQQALQDCIYHADNNIDILPAHISSLRIPSFDFFELKKLKKNFLSLFKNYDDVVIDTRPSLDWFSRLGIILGEYIIMPVAMSRYSYEALDEALNEIETVVAESPEFKKVIVFENRGKKQKVVLKETFRNLFKERLGEAFSNKILFDVISIDERTAGNRNYFETDSKQKKEVECFFNILLGELNG